MKCVVLNAFRDKDNFAKAYTAGSEVEFSTERAKYLKNLGLVDFEKSQDDTDSESESIDLTAGWQKIVSDAKNCDHLEDLEKSLIAETNGKNRKSVIDALQARIAELQPIE